VSLVPSLLQAIVHVDGEALVMHAGDKPYVVSPTGQVDLATRGLALDAVNGIVNQLLPPELQQSLDEFGAVQHELAPLPEFPGEHFTIVAARGGDDVWVEIRRRRISDDDRVPEELFTPTEHTPSAPYPVYAAAGSPSLAGPVEPLPDSLELGDMGVAREEATDLEYQEPVEVDVDFDERNLPLTQVEPESASEVMPESPALAAILESQEQIERKIEESVALPQSHAPELVPPVPPETVAVSLEVVPSPSPDVLVLPPPVPETPAAEATVLPVPSPALQRSAPVVSATLGPSSSKIEAGASTESAEPEVRQPAAVAPPVPALVRPPREDLGAVIPPAAAQVAIPVPVVAAIEPTPIPGPVAEVATPLATVAPAPPPIELPPPPAFSAVVPPPMVPIELPPQPTFSTRVPLAAPRVEPLSPPVSAVAPPAPPTVERPPAAPPAPVESVSPAASQPAVVLPLARNPIRAEQPWPPVGDARTSGLDRLLRLSAARGASTMYLSSDSRPGVRVDGELQVLEGEPVLTARDVESLLLTLMPERNHEALRTGAATEWILDIEDVGRVRCMSFRDHRGPGGVFRLMPTRSVSVDQLGLPRAVQGLAIEPEGLVLVAGPRSSGKRTLISSFVDLINRTRRDHVITIEREINIVHERGNSFISQREVRGGDEELLAAARGALREDPDVLVIEDLRSAGLMTVALEASASGHLVVGGFSAHTATGTVDRIIDLYSPDHRRQVQLGLADSLRGVVVQVLLRKIGGGRVAAREVLLNTPAVSSVIAEGKTSQLPMAIEGGRRYGMVPLNDALVGLVQQGLVDGREAYRYASDRQGLLAALKHQGLDTSFVERLA
jgi:twitching motility protein PilT